MTDLFCDFQYVNAFMGYTGDLVHALPDNGDSFSLDT